MKKHLFPLLALLALAASPAAAQNTMNFTFSVPGHVAKKGVFVSLFGQNVGSNTQVSPGDPWVFAGNSSNTTSYSTVSTQTSAYTPVSTTAPDQGGNTTFSTASSTQIYIPTGATALFPSPIGNLTLTDGTTTFHATYNGTT
ncbi:MAG: hypothetical protein KGR46_02795, partial [Verrucomicrobia bacterium]|nr:hypothetical protein [Verrucomicrobiota bacterium]